MDDHYRELQRAFDGQAARFEAAPVQSDPQALARLVAFAALPAGARPIDAGCGPGLVAEAFLDAGFTVHGVDLSAEMLRRARQRCARFAPAPRSIKAPCSRCARNGHTTPRCPGSSSTTFAIPLRSSARRRRLDPQGRGDRRLGPRHRSGCRRRRLAPFHRARPRPDARGEYLTSGGLVDALGRAGLVEVKLVEEPFELDFDEWFDRGTRGRRKRTSARGSLPAGRVDSTPCNGGMGDHAALRARARARRPRRLTVKVHARSFAAPQQPRSAAWHSRQSDTPPLGSDAQGEAHRQARTGRLITGDRMMIAHIYLKKGCLVPRHQHENEQITYVLRARCASGSAPSRGAGRRARRRSAAHSGEPAQPRGSARGHARRRHLRPAAPRLAGRDQSLPPAEVAQ